MSDPPAMDATLNPLTWLFGKAAAKARPEPPVEQLLPVLRLLAERSIPDGTALPPGYGAGLRMAETVGYASGGSGYDAATHITDKGRAFVHKHRLRAL